MTTITEFPSGIIGQKIKDIYGRNAGIIVNIYSEIDGTITGIEMQFADSNFSTIDPVRIRKDGETIVLLPEWKSKSIRIMSYLEKAKKRQKALEELYNKGDISKSNYDDIRRKIESELIKLKEEYNNCKLLIKKRTNEIDDQLIQIEKVITSLKMSYIAGEISEISYKTSMELLRQSREMNMAEKEDLKRTLEQMEKIEKDSIEAKKLEEGSSPIQVKVLATS